MVSDYRVGKASLQARVVLHREEQIHNKMFKHTYNFNAEHSKQHLLHVFNVT